MGISHSLRLHELYILSVVVLVVRAVLLSLRFRSRSSFRMEG